MAVQIVMDLTGDTRHEFNIGDAEAVAKWSAFQSTAILRLPGDPVILVGSDGGDQYVRVEHDHITSEMCSLMRGGVRSAHRLHSTRSVSSLPALSPKARYVPIQNWAKITHMSSR
jgi:hypothetical protein